VARAGKHWTSWLEVVTLSAFIWVFDEVEDATKVRTNAAVGNHIASGQFNNEARDFANFSLPSGLYSRYFWLNMNGIACPRFGEIFVCKCRNRRLSQMADLIHPAHPEALLVGSKYCA
jgi:hypothetical protein